MRCPRTLSTVLGHPVCVLGQQCPELSQDWARDSGVPAHPCGVLSLPGVPRTARGVLGRGGQFCDDISPGRAIDSEVVGGGCIVG